VLVTDTVGFIRDLPHDLVAAFRATLEEVTDADFLIHVVDASHPQIEEHTVAVHQVLGELGADDKPMVTVFNKSDLVVDEYALRKLVADVPGSVYISAVRRDGIPQLMSLLSRVVKGLLIRVSLEIPYERSDLVSLCYESGKVLGVEYLNDRILVEAEVSKEAAGKLQNFVRGSE